MLRGPGASSTSPRTRRARESASTANTLLAAWPDPAELLSETHFYLGLGDHPGQRLQAIRWAEVAVSRDPTNPCLLVMLSSYQLVAGQYRAAQQSALTGTDATCLLALGPERSRASLRSLLGEHSEAHHWFALSLGGRAATSPPYATSTTGSASSTCSHIG